MNVLGIGGVLSDAAAVLKNDVVAAQRNLDAVTQHLAQSNLESQTQQTNIALLTAATLPWRPSSPRVSQRSVSRSTR